MGGFVGPAVSLAGTKAMPPLNMPGSKPTGPCLGPEMPGSDAELSEKYSALTGTVVELWDREELVETFGIGVVRLGSS